MTISVRRNEEPVAESAPCFQFEVTIGAKLRGRPRRHRVANVVDLAAGQADKLAVSVPANQNHPVSEPDQPIERLHRHRTGREIAGHDDLFGGLDERLGQDGIERRQHAVHV